MVFDANYKIINQEWVIYLKIGEVSKLFNLSKETLRYYMDLGLIVAHKKGSLFEFDETAQNDIKWIVKLKEMKFSLNEIYNIISLRRVSNWVEPEDIKDYIFNLKEKKGFLNGELLNLREAIEKIEVEINTFSNSVNQIINKTGVPLKALEYLQCPKCADQLSVNNAQISYKYIFNGTLKCACGYEIEIINGIVITKNKNISPYDKPDLNRELYKGIPPNLVTLFQKSYNWMLNKINNKDMKNKVILETHINAYFFLYNNLKKIKNDCLFIIIDKFPETLYMYKERIDFLGLDLDILYIADSSYNYPIKKNCIDILIDFFGTNEHSIYRETFLIKDIEKYLNRNAEIIGTYFYFEPFSKSIKQLTKEYPENYQNNFNLIEFKKSLIDEQFKIDDYEEIGFTKDSGDNLAFSFHIKDEKMSLYSFVAKK